MFKATTFAGLAAAVLAFLPGRSAAESWPTLPQYVGYCVLIVKCRTEVKDKAVRYKVVDTWKGKYSPDLFYHKPADGYLATGTWHGNESPTDGREVIFFFTEGNQPKWAKGKLLDHSTAFVVTDGKVVYASTGGPDIRKEYAVDDFKKAVKDALDAKAKEDAPKQK